MNHINRMLIVFRINMFKIISDEVVSIGWPSLLLLPGGQGTKAQPPVPYLVHCSLGWECVEGTSGLDHSAQGFRVQGVGGWRKRQADWLPPWFVLQIQIFNFVSLWYQSVGDETFFSFVSGYLWSSCCGPGAENTELKTQGEVNSLISYTMG